MHNTQSEVHQEMFEFVVEELDSPYRTLTSPYNITNVLVAEWEQSPVARFQNLVKSLPRRMEAFIVAC